MSIANQIKRGSAELAVLSVLAEGPMHGYQIARTIEQQSDGALVFTLAALYPMLYRMEKRGWIKGEWNDSASGRRVREYRLTPKGRKQLPVLRKEWSALFNALKQLAGVANA